VKMVFMLPCPLWLAAAARSVLGRSVLAKRTCGGRADQATSLSKVGLTRGFMSLTFGLLHFKQMQTRHVDILF
jgi:hypothetical protein